MNRIEIINKIISSRGFQNYLEIGVNRGFCFRQIVCKNKIGVDPFPIFSDQVVSSTSDDFFSNYQGPLFDFVFVDGLHESHQAQKDIENSLKFTTHSGVILVHDTLPKIESHQFRSLELKSHDSHIWTGDVWKAIFRLRSSRDDIRLFTLNCDWGCTIIQKKRGSKIEIPGDLDWKAFLTMNRSVLNVVDPSLFDIATSHNRITFL